MPPSARVRAKSDYACNSLGEFSLSRPGRVTTSETIESPHAGRPEPEWTLLAALIPAAVALYELELYVAVQACDGAPPPAFIDTSHANIVWENTSAGRTEHLDLLLAHSRRRVGDCARKELLGPHRS